MERQEAQQLLPWYVNGTLSRDERREIERHLEESPDLAEELEELKLLQEVVIESGQASAQSSPDLFRQVMNTIEREEDGDSVSHRFGWLDWLRQPLTASLAAASLLFATTSIWLGSQVYFSSPSSELSVALDPESAAVLRPPARSAVQQLSLAPKQDRIAVRIDVNAESLEPFFILSCELRSADSERPLQVFSAPVAETLFINLNAAGLEEGEYQLLIHGQRRQSESPPEKLTEYRFSLKRE